MNRLSLVSQQKNQSNIRLHTDIINILFSHKKEVSNKFRDIKGLHCLDHIAINIVNPENEVVIFSFTPSIEYNLIIQGLWQYDITFCSNNYEDNTIIWWDKNSSDTDNEIRKIKETDHNFTLGFNINKKINGFKLIYSFATRNKDEYIRQYYTKIKQELVLFGDYCYKLINNLYLLYCSGHEPPVLISNYIRRHHTHLRLISNQDEKIII